VGGRKGTSRRKRDALTPHYCELPSCAYVKIFQRHRIQPGRDGGKYKLGNVIALCPNHHAEADRGWITVEELLEIVRLRIDRDVVNDPYRQAEDLDVIEEDGHEGASG
jgi:hypothetical protein